MHPSFEAGALPECRKIFLHLILPDLLEVLITAGRGCRNTGRKEQVNVMPPIKKNIEEIFSIYVIICTNRLMTLLNKASSNLLPEKVSLQ